jgi:hypothetical protein
MAVTEFTTAPAGTGKSLVRCARYLADDFLIHTDSHLWTNYPINLVNLSEFVAARSKVTVEQVIQRIHFIPKEVLDEWRDYKSSPLKFFHDKNLDGCRIAIDEIHNFIGIDAPKAISQEWRKFLGEIRHRGCEFEGISQNESKVNKVVRDEAGLKRLLFNDEVKPDPFFGIVMHDWYQLKAKFLTGSYIPLVWQQDKTEVHAKWVVTGTKCFPLDPIYFPLYDSYSTPHSGGNKSQGKKHPYQSKTKIQLIIWFLVKNSVNLVFRLFLFCLIVWVCFFGGGKIILTQFLKIMATASHANASASPHVASSAAAALGAEKPGALPIDASLSAGKSPVDVAVTLANQAKELEKLQASLAKETDKRLSASAEVVRLTAKNEELTKELSQFSAIVMLGKNSITFKSGLSVRVGDVIPAGLYRGLVLQGINHEKRYAWLSDRSILFLVL